LLSPLNGTLHTRYVANTERRYVADIESYYGQGSTVQWQGTAGEYICSSPDTHAHTIQGSSGEKDMCAAHPHGVNGVVASVWEGEGSSEGTAPGSNMQQHTRTHTHTHKRSKRDKYSPPPPPVSRVLC
jgi:hypothetical protein